ncbi:MAG: amino acid ABC transporter permease [Proteobacteria bacterium]|nr:amino acid ABC transporter permease [Pseudomonadota bacterium]MBI3499150.1 amino acid ABC transporter permease [Pseudomonadota bacterium]
MNYHINYNFVWKYFDKLTDGLVLSLEMAFVSILIGIMIGLGLALAYNGSGRMVRWIIAAYVEIIRNVPLLLLVYLVFYGIPTVGGFAYDATTSFIMTLSVYSGAYLVEIFRAGLDAVPKGLIDAGKAIGLTPIQHLVSVRLPTMFRIVLPSLSNTFVSLFKDTSVAWVIAVPELFFGYNWIYTNTFRIVEGLSVLAAMYLVTCYVFIFALQQLERRYAIGRN